ncbi:hypothetical protein AA105894_1939 [Asaia spathodeae NBRC 105894]|nr:hypothetical protein AA105894_1939 [Asaia spathodeae NBRC 105894]
MDEKHRQQQRCHQTETIKHREETVGSGHENGDAPSLHKAQGRQRLPCATVWNTMSSFPIRECFQ